MSIFTILMTQMSERYVNYSLKICLKSLIHNTIQIYIHNTTVLNYHFLQIISFGSLSLIFIFKNSVFRNLPACSQFSHNNLVIVAIISLVIVAIARSLIVIFACSYFGDLYKKVFMYDGINVSKHILPLRVSCAMDYIVTRGFIIM